MRQILIKSGEAVLETVPDVKVSPSTILVKLVNSCISSGTEIAGVKSSGEPLWRKAMRQPENVKKVLNTTMEIGVKNTIDLVKSKVAAARETGYSAAGIVVEVGSQVNEFRIGDRVACAGAGLANHAELVAVPKNLVTKLPENVSFEEGSTVTLGAIALQGVRRLNPTIGERFGVIGLGVLGQLSCQILRANGCKVIGIDIEQGRCDLALSNGLDLALNPLEGDLPNKIDSITNGAGLDGVIVCAASNSSGILSQAFNACRKKGRVVVVGDVGLDINRSDIYQKELDLLISTSYGPGRYDDHYENKGLDYPLAYVRWTENRNMQAYLDLIAANKVSISNMVAKTYDLTECTIAYHEIEHSSDSRPISLFSYSSEFKSHSKIQLFRDIKNRKNNKVSIGFVGAGSFLQSMHLPNLRKISSDVSLDAICTRGGARGWDIAKQYSIPFVTNQIDDLLESDVELIFISTRHNLHGQQVLKSLQAGKDVFVEKPLCLTDEELDLINDFFEKTNNPPRLTTGFNRRFSPHVTAMKKQYDQRQNPGIINYYMNAGKLPPDHWTNSAEGGGRNRGEACHIYNLFCFLTQSKAISVHATTHSSGDDYQLANENFVTTINFEDGSIANLIYTSKGSSKFPKETFSISFDGITMSCENYQSIRSHGIKLSVPEFKVPNKGQLEELKALVHSTRLGQETIPYWEQHEATRIANVIEKQINKK